MNEFGDIDNRTLVDLFKCVSYNADLGERGCVVGVMVCWMFCRRLRPLWVREIRRNFAVSLRVSCFEDSSLMRFL